MGVAINHRLGQRKHLVKPTLDRAQRLAEQMQKELAPKVETNIEIRRPDEYTLLIDISGCETLAFEFKGVDRILHEWEIDGWTYEWATLTDNGAKDLDEGYNIVEFPQNEIYYASAFCETQYAGSLVAHRWVAELIRVVASRCHYAEVNDEGDYYHTGKIEDAEDAIVENGAMIDGLTAQIASLGFEAVKGGETRIKSRKRD